MLMSLDIVIGASSGNQLIQAWQYVFTDDWELCGRSMRNMKNLLKWIQNSIIVCIIIKWYVKNLYP